MKDRELIESYIPMVKFIAAISGPRCEVVLHDLSDIEHSIIAIENGYISGRKVGDGFMDFAYKKFMSEHAEGIFVTNISGKSTKDNKTLRLSGYRIRRKHDDEIIGLLCVTEDITDLIYIHKVINSDLFIDDGFYKETENLNGMIALPLADTLESIFEYTMHEAGFFSVDNMHRDDKLRVITALKENNIFEIKGSVNFIAKKINLSAPSVYRYLKQAKINETETV